MTENPERLIAWRVKRYSLVLTHGPAFAAEAALLGDAPSCPEEVLYVRANIAAAEKAALVAERDALATRIEKLRAELQNIFDESDSSEHSIVRVESMAVLADRALTEDDALSGKGVG